jgi:hypothetical protein
MPFSINDAGVLLRFTLDNRIGYRETHPDGAGPTLELTPFEYPAPFTKITLTAPSRNELISKALAFLADKYPEEKVLASYRQPPADGADPGSNA